MGAVIRNKAGPMGPEMREGEAALDMRSFPLP